MKRIFTISAALLLTVSLIGQNVSREEVVVEIATGTWCPFCPGAAMGADDLIENGHDVAVIKYHNGDPYANVYSNYRNSYYNVSGFPTAHFDGQNSYVGGSGSQSLYGPYLSRVNQRLAIMSSYTIDVTGTHAGLEEFDLEVTVEKVGTHNGNNTVLHAVLTESHIEEYWQGMDELNFVCRLMAPDQFGTPLDFSGGNTQVVNLTMMVDDNWNPENCELVFFVQSTTNKEILQGIKRELLSFPSEFERDANLKEVANLPLAVCSGSMEPSVTIRNLGNDDITSLDIKYRVNNGDLQTFAWTGLIEYLGSVEVDLGEINFGVIEENQIEIYTENPNGNPDEYPVNDSSEQMIEMGMYTPSSISLILRTDENPGETTWELLNSAGDVLYSGGPYSSSGQMVMEDFELPEVDCYSFIVYDSGNDGFSPPGFYMLYYGSNVVIAEGSSFGAQHSTEFTADDAVGMDEASVSGTHVDIYPNPFRGEASVRVTLTDTRPVHVTVYSVSGEKVFESDRQLLDAGMHDIRVNLEGRSSGLYVARVIAGDEVITEKITLR
jgi:hypothetical protein